LYNYPTLGLAWINLLMTVALWFAVPARRKLILWMLAVILTTIVAFGAVFASFVGITGLSQVLEYTEEITAARYLFPMLVAWSATNMTLLFAEPVPQESNPGADATAVPAPTPAPGHRSRVKPNSPISRK
jgi:glucan phosphoethanolaminetransferase (alkaline phosphatase superfamily)